MRSTTNCTIGCGEVYAWAQDHLLRANLLKDHGRRCTAKVVLAIVLRAAAESISVSAACRDLAKAPSDHAVLTALEEGLPKTLPVLERRVNEALTGDLPRRLARRAWDVAIDYHMVPYYGRPWRSRNEICRSQPKQGTSQFHVYATACIVEYGRRYTIALTWVRRHETMVTILRRLVTRIRNIGLKIKCLLADRAFFNVAAIRFLQQEKVPFLMPVKFAGRRPKKGRKSTGLRRLKQQPAGWYGHTMKSKGQEVAFSVCVGYRRYRHRRTGKQKRQKLLFAAWRVRGTPTAIRERYRTRFGIETSYRQRRQGRIYTCVRDPHVRLFFVAVSLLLRNVWVWIHHMLLAEGSGDTLTLHLERLRYKRMLAWIVRHVIALYHDGTAPCVNRPP